jgi:hypothetical protein
VDESSPLRWGIPASFVLVGAAGVGYGLMLKIRRPHVYAAIGMGAKSAALPQVGGQYAGSEPTAGPGAAAAWEGRR